MHIARLAGMQQASTDAAMSNTGPIAKTSKPCHDDSNLMMGKTREIGIAITRPNAQPITASIKPHVMTNRKIAPFCAPSAILRPISGVRNTTK